MCGGFTCSKNALIALNVLYIVSKLRDKGPLFTIIFSGCSFYPNWSCGLWSCSIFSHKFTNRRGNLSMWYYPGVNFRFGALRGCQTPSSDAVFCILNKLRVRKDMILPVINCVSFINRKLAVSFVVFLNVYLVHGHFIFAVSYPILSGLCLSGC